MKALGQIPMTDSADTSDYFPAAGEELWGRQITRKKVRPEAFWN
jgi:hypothetical protein